MEKETKQIILYLSIILIFLGVLNFFIPKKPFEKGNVTKAEEVFSFNLPHIFFKNEDSTIVSIKVPAVSSEGKGAVVLLTVEAVKGTGKTLVNIDNLLFWADTQHSIRMARLIAGNVSGKNLSEFDLIYSIKTDASAIGGPSAGAAITIATIFALNGERPREDVTITGTINHDGTIGPVDNILEKAQASKNFNISTILVPLLQGKDILYEERKYCHKFGASEICTLERIPKEVNIAREVNITVEEIRDIKQAIEFFKSVNSTNT
ncbi:MAG: S16 family serine protease [Candidatus Pacearchaeota archaeon]